MGALVSVASWAWDETGEGVGDVMVMTGRMADGRIAMRDEVGFAEGVHTALRAGNY